MNALRTTIDWNNTYAAVWRPQKAYLRAIKHIDPISLNDLLGVDAQKAQLQRNTERFLDGLPANNALLWGARGTGKSSLIKALLNAYHFRGLRLLQVDKNDLINLPEIVDDIRELPQHFIVFCDDLSFEAGDPAYKALKSVLEGSVELPPDNVRVYATSNRRHLLPEFQDENQSAKRVGNEIHFPESVEEKISLSDRFGLWLSFHPINQDDYLTIVDSLFPDYHGDHDELHLAAKQFALARGGRSGRVARQFFNEFMTPAG